MEEAAAPAGVIAGVVSVSSRSTPEIGSLVPRRTTTPSTEAVPVRCGWGVELGQQKEQCQSQNVHRSSSLNTVASRRLTGSS